MGPQKDARTDHWSEFQVIKSEEPSKNVALLRTDPVTGRIVPLEPENEPEIVAETGLTRHWRALMTRSLAPRVDPDDIFFSYQTLLRDPR